MERLQRFANNAGLLGTFQTIFVLVIMLLLIRHDFGTGNWFVTLPIVAAMQGVGFMLRDFLVDNFSWVKWVMNAIAIAAFVVFSVNREQPGAEHLCWLRATLSGCISLYIGCYFWMLSDPRIARMD